MKDLDADLLSVLSCEIDARPSGAPTLDEILPMLRNVQREPKALVIEFDSASSPIVEAFAAAERQCCSAIGWEVGGLRAATLRITAEPAQLDVLEGVFAGDNHL
jgi:hypothetical protein